MKRVLMQLLRSIVTVIVVGTMAVMIFSLREELALVKSKLSASGAAQDDGVYVLCRFDLKPETDIGDYVKKTLAVVPTVRAEDGCFGYALLRDADTGGWEKPMKFGERTMWCVEHWSSVDALKAHLEAPHMKRFGPTVRDMRTGATFHVLESAGK